MLTAIIRRTEEPSVVKLTEENIEREAFPPGSELIVCTDWWEGLSKTDTKYVCFLESDCLVGSGYFMSMTGLFQKNPQFTKLAMMSPSVCLNDWSKRIYGYKLGNNYADGVKVIRDKTSTRPHPVQIGYVPGSIIRTSMMKKAVKELKLEVHDLVKFSSDLSLFFWETGQRVYANPNASYVTTEEYVGFDGRFDPKPSDIALGIFEKEMI